MTVELNELQRLVSDWDAKKKAADKAVYEERDARARMVAAGFPDPDLPGQAKLIEGAGNKVSIGFGKILQITHNISRSIDAAAWDARKAHIPHDVIDSVMRFKPEVSVTGWKALPASAKLLFDGIIFEKPGTPQVKIVAAKSPEEGK